MTSFAPYNPVKRPAPEDTTANSKRACHRVPRGMSVVATGHSTIDVDKAFSDLNSLHDTIQTQADEIKIQADANEKFRWEAKRATNWGHYQRSRVGDLTREKIALATTNEEQARAAAVVKEAAQVVLEARGDAMELGIALAKLKDILAE